MKFELRIITINSSTSSISNISHNVNVLLVVEDPLIFWMQLQLWSVTSCMSFARNASITVW